MAPRSRPPATAGAPTATLALALALALTLPAPWADAQFRDSRPPVTISHGDAGAFRLSFVAGLGWRYQVQSSPDLTRWTDQGDWIQGDGSAVQAQVEAPGVSDRGFFRLLAEFVPVEVDGFILLPAGSFTMGSPDDEPGRSDIEGPAHPVTLTGVFFLKATEVTWAEWNDVRDGAEDLGYTDIAPGEGGGGTSLADADHPVIEVSWWDVVKWCNLRSEIEGRTPVYYTDPGFAPGDILRTGTPRRPYPDPGADGYRLPTEAEWEYACRAGTSTAYYTGPITGLEVDPALDRSAWYRANAGNRTHPVGQKEANAFGLSDMHGNVWEWVWDWFQPDYYATSPPNNPPGPATGGRRLCRGGSLFNDSFFCRSASRSTSLPTYRAHILGFRPARRATGPVAGE